MINRKVFFVLCLIGMSSLIFAGCNTNLKRADIPGTASPQEEISKMDTDLGIASSKNVDVLASPEFTKSVKWLKEAKLDQASQQKQTEILDDLRISRAFLDQAHQISEGRSQQAPGLFSSRQAALAAGASKHLELENDLQKIDEDVSSKAATLSNLDSAKIAALQERYVDLERRATILTELGTSQATFNGLKNDRAAKLAPQTFKQADLALKNAESVISANVRYPQGYKAAVSTATTQTVLLSDVINTIKQNGGKLSEPTALKMVAQNSRINSLSRDLSNSTAENAANTSAMAETNEALNQELKEKNSDLKSAAVSIRTQKAMEVARSQFSTDEAEAYQQGKNLLIRLKQINFASGRADLPESSLPVLAKVSSVAKSMNASEIKVEGHTDSVGNVSQNKVLSDKRASAVASYFKSNGFNEVTSAGYGFQKPIATNKSENGRAQNRRVDIIITPDASSASE